MPETRSFSPEEKNERWVESRIQRAPKMSAQEKMEWMNKMTEGEFKGGARFLDGTPVTRESLRAVLAALEPGDSYTTYTDKYEYTKVYLGGGKWQETSGSRRLSQGLA